MKGPFIGRSSIQVEPNLEFVALSEREENTIRLKSLKILLSSCKLCTSVYFHLCRSFQVCLYIKLCVTIGQMGNLGIKPSAPKPSSNVSRQLSSRRSDPPVPCLRLARRAGIEEAPLPEWVPGRQRLLQQWWIGLPMKQ